MLTAQFYKSVRSTLFSGLLRQGVVDTLNLITETYTSIGGKSTRELAYILATAYHESYHKTKNPDFLPIREGYAKTNLGSIRAVNRLFKAQKININYALPDAKGRSYYGRGFVQITWADNYRRLGKIIGIDLLTNPDRALEPVIAARLLVIGMIKGSYTGEKLSQYISITRMDFRKARRVINGTDKATLIAEYADKFYAALTAR